MLKEVGSVLSRELVMQLIQKNFDKIRSFGVVSIGVFGSTVTGQRKETSDVDVLVEFDVDRKSFDNYMDLKFFLEELFETKVDLVIKDTIKPALRSYILDSVVYAT